VPLLRRAYQLWHELEEASGRKLLHQTGGLYVGAPESGLVAGSLQASRDHGLDHELLDQEQLARRYPQFNLPESYIGFWDPHAGLLLSEHAVSTHAELALRCGAELHGHEPVTSWTAGAGGVTVATPKGEYRAGRVVFCGGAWSDRLVSDLGVPLRVTRQVLGWLWPREPERFQLGTLPVWAVEDEKADFYYGFPMMAGALGLKVAHHWQAGETDPDHVVREPIAGDEEDFRPAVRRFLPGADGPLLGLTVCLYTNTPDSHFVVDSHPEHKNVTLACGFSGHGFKFASVMGEALADLALEGNSRLPMDFLALKRFDKDAVGISASRTRS
jgi:sarcosine oxidase